MRLLIGILLASLLSFSPSRIQREPQVVVHNRILATIEGEPISVMDVMKKMDFFLSQHYPQYLDSSTIRIQFYTSQWRQTLQQLIDNKLMVADAASRKVETSDADVREEIQSRWGPNVMAALDKMGLTLAEAEALVRQELTVQKMQWLRVTSKVMPRITTEVLKSAYQTHLKTNPPKEMWTYQFITLRDTTAAQAAALASEIDKHKGDLNTAINTFKQSLSAEEEPLVTLSSELHVEDKEIATSHRDILKTLTPNTISLPVVQKSRDGSEVTRIFQLKAHTQQTAAPFEKLAAELRMTLLNQKADAEMDLYLARLYQRFNYSPKELDIPPHFEPFSLE